MTLATRCPHCGTAFRLVRDQLLLSQGWVRCGRCQQAFDAAAYQFEPEMPAPPAAAAASQAPRPSDAQDLETADPDHIAPRFDLAHAVAETDPAEMHAAETPSAWIEAPDPAEAVELAQLREEAFPPTAIFDEDHHDEMEPQAGVAPESAGASEPEAPPEPEFLRQARARERWQRPWVRALLGLAASALLFAAAAQATWVWRDAIAARWPATRGAMQAFCRVGGYVLQPALRPQDLVIDASSMSPGSERSLLLDVRLRNRGPLAIAYPALEVTLSGTQEQTLVRRVILPAEYLAATRRLPAPGLAALLRAGIAPAGTLQLHLVLRTRPGLQPGGYAVYAFYP